MGGRDDTIRFNIAAADPARHPRRQVRLSPRGEPQQSDQALRLHGPRYSFNGCVLSNLDDKTRYVPPSLSMRERFTERRHASRRGITEAFHPFDLPQDCPTRSLLYDVPPLSELMCDAKCLTPKVLRPRWDDGPFASFRLMVILALSMLRSGDTPARAASLLSCLLGMVVLRTTYTMGERFAGSGLTRWHEGAFLLVLGGVLLIWFGR